MGREPTDWKPMSNIGSSVREIRTHEGNEYRTIYIAKYEEAIYVLHSFVKKSHKTAKKDIALAKIRLKEANKLRK
ncbi:MAG: type II toxin-antitoxin system RelE/ParE family toxin [Proteobacteria bacterium]|nr:type II toxin-antitoxin system RelE/ParE family toxin [Pseudomonadota bacterium]